MISIRYCTNPLKKLRIFTHMHKLCVPGSPREEEPGDEANTTIDYIYMVECESELQ